MPLEFQTALPPHVFGIPVQETPPLPRNSKMPPVVWYGYFLESPNGPHHHYTTVLLYLAEVNMAFSVKLMEYNQFEAGEGKTVLDTHFTRVSHKTVWWVSVGNDLDTREKLGNLLEVISTLYLSSGLTWLGTNTRGILGESESSCESDRYSLHTGTFNSPKIPSMFMPSFWKHKAVISYLFVTSSSKFYATLRLLFFLCLCMYYFRYSQ